MIRRFKRRAWLMCPFFLSVAVLLAAYAKYGVYPFGGKVAFCWDGTENIFPHLAALRRAFLSGKEIGYTLHTLFGMDPTAIYAYELASPFNLIAVLFPAGHLPEAYLAIILLKTGVSATAFAAYARSCLKAGRLTAVLFSLGYSLMGWMTVHSYFLMFLDALIWLPPICMGLHRLLERGRPAMLTLCYAALFWSNFYMGYLVAVFSALYCAVWIALRANRDCLRRLLLRGAAMIACGLLALGMVACLIVPTFLLTMGGKAAIGNALPQLAFSTMNMDARLSSLVPLLPAALSGVTTNAFDVKLFHGTLALALSIGFLCHRDAPARKRAIVGGALLLLFYSLQNNWLNLAWHLMNAPYGFLFRQSFLLSFSSLALGVVMFESLCKRKAHAKQAALRGSLILLFALLLINGLTGKTTVPVWQYSVNLALIGLGAVLLQLWASASGQRARSAVAACLLLLMGLDTYHNASQVFSTFSFTDRATYADAAGTQKIVNFIADQEPAPYRLGNGLPTSSNDGSLYGYPAGSHSSSTSNLQTLNLANTMGFDDLGFPILNTTYRSNLITDALFGFRYILDGPEGNPVYETEHTDAGSAYQRNPYALPLLYAAPGSFDGIPAVAEYSAQDAMWFRFDVDVAGVQHALLQRIAPGTGCFARLSPDAAEAARAVYTCRSDGLVYVYPPWTTERGYTARWNGEPVALYGITQALVGFAHAGDRIEIQLDEEEEGSEKPAWLAAPAPTSAAAWQVAQIDQQAFTQLATGIQAKTRSVQRLSDTSFSAEVTVAPGDRLFITLPYSPGWSLRADGQPVPLEKALQAFMGAELEPGEHTLLLSYTQPGRNLGLAISGVCWLAFGLYVVFAIRARGKNAG